MSRTLAFGHQRPCRTAGFTLLEVLIAVAVFAVFSTLAYGSLSRLLDSRDRIETERVFWRQLALTFVQIEDDVGNARTRTIRDVYGNPAPAFRGQPTDTRAVSEPSFSLTRGGIFVLGEGVHPDLARVGYRLTDGRLERLIWPALDQPAQIEPSPVTLFDNVREFRARFYAGPSGWADVWPTSGSSVTSIPLAIEITLTIENRGTFVRLFRVGA